MEETSNNQKSKKMQRDLIIAIIAVIVLVLAGIFFVYILIALLVLLFMVTIHELGHYIAAKCLRFKVKQFSIGMGPAIFSRVSKRTGEKFAIRCIPLGGFCSFEDDDEKEKKNPAAFNNQKPWKRIIVLVSGAFANIVTSILILFLIFSISGTFFPSVEKVFSQPAFYEAVDDEGKKITVENKYIIPEDDLLKKGDIILEANGVSVDTGDLSLIRELDPGESVNLVIKRDGKTISVKAYVGIFTGNDGKAYKGLGIERGYARFGFFETIGKTFQFTFKMAGTILTFLGRLVTGQENWAEVGGPATTVEVISQVAQTNFRNFVYLVGLIGINLAVFNLLPFPALDGARIVFVVIEWIFRRPVNRNVEAMIHLVGLIVLFAFVAAVEIYHWFIAPPPVP